MVRFLAMDLRWILLDEDYRKLITPETNSAVDLPYLPFQEMRRLHENGAPHEMVMVIVDVLETIEIEEQHRKIVTVAIGAG